MKIGRDVRPTRREQWLKHRDELIRARDHLLGLAPPGGTDPRYQLIADDWLCVRPARDGQVRGAGTRLVFQSSGHDMLESNVHAALKECWEKIRELRLMFHAIRRDDLTTALGLDLGALTEKETAFIAAGPD